MPSTPAWIQSASTFETPGVYAFRLFFELKKGRTVAWEVSADERYRLFLDGKPIGRGPERGDVGEWYYETYRRKLQAGRHVLVAQVWALGDLAPVAQISIRPGFYLRGCGKDADCFSTGVADWEAKRLTGWRCVSTGGTPRAYYAIGTDFEITDHPQDRGFSEGNGEGWLPVMRTEEPGPDIHRYGLVNGDHHLRPAKLPPMFSRQHDQFKVRFVERLRSNKEPLGRVDFNRHIPHAADAWQQMFCGEDVATIPARSRYRILIDLENYCCGYPHIEVSGGRGTSIEVRCAEALFEDVPTLSKGRRDEIEGKSFASPGDRFIPDGKRCHFEPLWWRAGRFIQIEVKTGGEALVIHHFGMELTGYPLGSTTAFDCSDERFSDVEELGLRTLQSCMHETYMDCPHYEQLMYAGDTRLEMLTHYALAADSALQRKALMAFDRSRDASGFIKARFPSRGPQVIPPFALWWVASVCDYALWRNDPEFVRHRMPGVRAVIEAYLHHRNDDGLISNVDGWNFVDWVPAWEDGVPPDGVNGASGVINWQFTFVLSLAAQLERYAGEKDLAVRANSLASAHASATAEAFWSEQHGMFADDIAKNQFSEHAQCLAVLSGKLTKKQLRRVGQALTTDNKLERATVYFSHYLLEAFRALGNSEAIFRRLQPWLELRELGLTTIPEQPEPSRSDCHAWGAHPLFHHRATILGARPASHGFTSVEIKPMLGQLQQAKGEIAHEKGPILVELRRSKSGLGAQIELPPNLEGIFRWNKMEVPLRSGRQKLEL